MSNHTLWGGGAPRRAAAAAGPERGSEAAAAGPVSELVTGDKRIRLEGVFISHRGRVGVISIREQKKPRSSSLQTIAVGDQVEGLTVAAIRPAAVVFRKAGGAELEVRIFSPGPSAAKALDHGVDIPAR
jgi:hypothetical protein